MQSATPNEGRDGRRRTGRTYAQTQPPWGDAATNSDAGVLTGDIITFTDTELVTTCVQATYRHHVKPHRPPVPRRMTRDTSLATAWTRPWSIWMGRASAERPGHLQRCGFGTCTSAPKRRRQGRQPPASAASWTFTPTVALTGTMLSDIMVPGVTRDDDYLTFGYWVRSDFGGDMGCDAISSPRSTAAD